MSKEAYDWAMSFRAKDATQRLILVSMGYVADAHGWNSYQSNKSLAEDGLCSERTVSRHLRELMEAGVIEITIPSRRARPTTFRLIALDPDRQYDPDRSDDRLASQSRRQKSGTPSAEPVGSPMGRQCLDNDSPNPASSPLIGTGSGVGSKPVGQARPVSDVQRVFDAWIEATGRTGRSKLTGDRQGRIIRYLKDYPVEDLVDACRGIMKHPHYRGENDRNEVYTDLEHCLKGPKQIELFRDLHRGLIPPPLSTRTPATNGRTKPMGDTNMETLGTWLDQRRGAVQ
jgi:Helix-turn-helix domain